MMQSPHAPCLFTVCPTITTMPKAHQWHTLSLHILKGPTPPAPTLCFLFSSFFPLISIVTVLSHARAFLLASCHILLLSSCLEVSLSQAGRVELLWVLPAFARCSFGVGSWQAWQPIPTGPLSCDSSLPAGSLKHPLYSPIQMKAWDWLSFFGQSACNCRNKGVPYPHPTRRQTFLTGLGD